MINIESKDLYLRIFDNAVVAIGVTNREGYYVLVNKAWCDFLGYTKEEALHLKVGEITPPDDRNLSDENFHKLIQGEIDSFSKKRRYQKKNGEVFWADLYVSSIHNDDGKIMGVLGIFSNIDQQVRAEQQQRELTSYLEKLSDDLENSHEAMVKKNHELTEAYENLERLARYDSLTGLYNRRTLEEIMGHEIRRSLRTKRGFVLAIADIDHFKTFNDTYGHDCGDEVLKLVSKTFLEMIRSTDTVGRWGGEEFIFILPETDCTGAEIVLDRLRQKVKDTVLDWEGKKLSVSITIGFSFHRKFIDADEMIREADKALYEGKGEGRNRVVSYQGCEQDEE